MSGRNPTNTRFHNDDFYPRRPFAAPAVPNFVIKILQDASEESNLPTLPPRQFPSESRYKKSLAERRQEKLNLNPGTSKLRNDVHLPGPERAVMTRSETPQCQVCYRPKKMVCCMKCRFTVKGNVRIICPEHPQQTFLHHMDACGMCKEPNVLREIDLED